MRAILILLLAASFALNLCGAQPRLDKIDVFEGGKEGYPVYRIPGIIVTSKGTVLAYCEARQSYSDWGTIDIVMRRSVDGGKTWGAHQKIADIPGPRKKNPLILGNPRVKADDVTFN